jgi:uncharacterized membrane protein YhaH (DUF805 family)|tara:strand:+ start:1594 stop:1980 length:387 start_codon:yes stop_codon:yes gene_type:complete
MFSSTLPKKGNRMEWYTAVLKKYVEFQGRARRKEYWMFILFNILASIICGVIDGILGIMLLVPLYSLAVLLPSIAVCIRRLHDTNRSGWWILISLVPFVGSIILLIFLCIEGDAGDNRFGPNPKLAAA